MRIRRATTEEVRHSCLRYHYAHRVPQVSAGYSVFNDSGEFCGTVCFGVGACPNIGRPYGLVQGEVLELVRVALNGKQGHGHTSEAVMAAVRQLHRDRPLLRLLVSYADMDQDHVGTIYKATNWVYAGKVGEGDRRNFTVDGKPRHARHMMGKEGERWRERGHVVEVTPTSGKHKYLYPLDRRMRRQVTPLARPYPEARHEG